MLEFLFSLDIALRALRVNKMRSFLTMLGIVIGIGAVIVMVALGSGASRRVSEQIATMGSNLILILPGSTTSGGIRAGMGSLPTLTNDDVKALRSDCPSLSLVAPTVRGTAQVVAGNMNWSTIIQGVTPEFFAIREWETSGGRPLGQADVDGALKTCVLGRTVADTLFGDQDPVDKVVRIKQSPFLVAGVLDSKGRSPQGTDQDDVVFIPITTAVRKILGSPLPNTVGGILAQARDEQSLQQAQAEATELLDQRHRIGPSKERDFSVRNLTEILEVAEQSSRIMSLLLGAVASISLVVGGIGIMNIMLVSVVERTREIGVRMALGAKERHIMLQFLTEAVLLTLLGGGAGIVLGVATAAVLSGLFNWPVLISREAVMIAVAFSSAIGVFFGFYPARKAAKLNPIDALRYE
jgi:putative ABC transport system permease protein